MASSPQELFRKAERLPARERRRLIARLEKTLGTPAGRKPVARKNEGLRMFLEMAGTTRCGASDVSSDKYNPD